MTTVVWMRVRVGSDHRISGTAPEGVPEGEHEAAITVAETRPARPQRRIADLPRHMLPWDDSISLRREDIYGADGR